MAVPSGAEPPPSHPFVASVLSQMSSPQRSNTWNSYASKGQSNTGRKPSLRSSSLGVNASGTNTGQSHWSSDTSMLSVIAPQGFETVTQQVSAFATGYWTVLS